MPFDSSLAINLRLLGFLSHDAKHRDSGRCKATEDLHSLTPSGPNFASDGASIYRRVARFEFFFVFV